MFGRTFNHRVKIGFLSQLVWRFLFNVVWFLYNQLYPWEAGWKDVVLLEDGETVEVLIRFENFRGIYLLHCHKLEHEDMGMMANFEVV